MNVLLFTAALVCGFSFRRIAVPFHDRQSTYVGQYVSGWRGRMDLNFMDNGTSFPLKAHTPAEIVIRALVMKKDIKAYNGRPTCMRLHASFAEPVTCRATFVDDQDRRMSICWDFANSPLRYRDFSSYDEMIALRKDGDDAAPRYANKDGIGADFACDLWLHVDDPETLNRLYVVVSSAKEGGDKWFVRCSKESGDFPTGSYSTIRPKGFKRMVYDARKKGESEVDVTADWAYGVKSFVTLTALLDLEAGVVWGLRAEIKIGGVTTSNSMLFDHARIKTKKD